MQNFSSKKYNMMLDVHKERPETPEQTLDGLSKKEAPEFVDEKREKSSLEGTKEEFDVSMNAQEIIPTDVNMGSIKVVWDKETKRAAMITSDGPQVLKDETGDGMYFKTAEDASTKSTHALLKLLGRKDKLADFSTKVEEADDLEWKFSLENKKVHRILPEMMNAPGTAFVYTWNEDTKEVGYKAGNNEQIYFLDEEGKTVKCNSAEDASVVVGRILTDKRNKGK